MTPELQRLRDAVEAKRALIARLAKVDPRWATWEEVCGPPTRDAEKALASLRLKQRRLAYERLVEAEAWADEERMHVIFVRWLCSRGWLLAWADWTVRKAVSRTAALARSMERMEAKWPELKD
jgi:hypothetical protein